MKIIKRIIFALCAFCMIFTLCGCAGYTRLNERLIVQMLFVEKTKNGYGITAFEQELDEEPGERVFAEGESPVLAVEQIGLASGKRPLLSHARYVAFSDNLSETELLNCLELMSKDNQVPPEAMIMYLKGCTGEELAKDEKYADAGARVQAVLGTAQESSMLAKTSVAGALTGYYDALSDFFMPVLAFEGENLTAQGTSVFKGNKIAGVLDTEETRALLLMQKSGCKFYISAGDARCNVTRTRLQKQLLHKENKPCVLFTITVFAVNTQGGISNDNAAKLLKNKLEAQIKDTAQKLTRDFGCDIFGLQTEAFLRHPAKKYTLKDIETDFEIKIIMS